MADTKVDFYSTKKNVEDFLVKILNGIEYPFYSEEDFRFTFANEIKKMGYDVTLEHPRSQLRGHIDLVVWENKEATTPIAFFEFKYKTKSKDGLATYHNVPLKNYSAQNDNRYYFFADIQKLERENTNINKYCIFLTNDISYQNQESDQNGGALDDMFRIYATREISEDADKKLIYGGNPNYDKHPEIDLIGTYPRGTFEWKTYEEGFGEMNPFYYLVVKVN